MSTRRRFIADAGLAGLGLWFAQRSRQVKAALSRYNTARYDSSWYGR